MARSQENEGDLASQLAKEKILMSDVECKFD
jgi:hypothetical protein